VTSERSTAIAPSPAHAELRAGRLRLFDIRASHERLVGMPAGAEGVDPGDLAARLAEAAGVPAVALICDRGLRSQRARDAHAADSPVPLLHVEGGLRAWRACGLPEEWPEAPFTRTERTRYQRHFALSGVGPDGQARLGRASVLIVGAGGLGSPCALYLAAAGVGRIDIVDDDSVELSNLQRQILHDEDEIGAPKVESAKRRLAGINSGIDVRPIRARLDGDNVEALIGPHDLVIDGSDNFPTRYILNDACIRLRRTLIYGAVERFAGQVGVFGGGDGRQPCYRCLFPTAPRPSDAPSCAEAGVLGVLPGIIGSMQAVEALKLLIGIGTPLTGCLVCYDALTSRTRRVRVRRDPACRCAESRTREARS